MPYAVTHVLIAVILFELFRDYFVKNKGNFSFHYIFIGGIASLIPDFDIALYYVLYFLGFSIEQLHRTFSHTLLLPLIFFGLAFMSYNFKNKKLGEHHLKLRNIFLVIGFGILIHLVLDAVIVGRIVPFYPFSTYSFGIDLIKVFPLEWQKNIMQSFDAGLLILWIIYLEVRHKISSFI